MVRAVKAMLSATVAGDKSEGFITAFLGSAVWASNESEYLRHLPDHATATCMTRGAALVRFINQHVI